MREIKFRMWDKDISSFIYFDLLDLCCDHYASREKIYQSLLNDKDVKIMQYTGLKDKKGKEIYEDVKIMQYTGLKDKSSRSNRQHLRKQ